MLGCTALVVTGPATAADELALEDVVLVVADVELEPEVVDEVTGGVAVGPFAYVVVPFQTK